MPISYPCMMPGFVPPHPQAPVNHHATMGGCSFPCMTPAYAAHLPPPSYPCMMPGYAPQPPQAPVGPAAPPPYQGGQANAGLNADICMYTAVTAVNPGTIAHTTVLPQTQPLSARCNTPVAYAQAALHAAAVHAAMTHPSFGYTCTMINCYPAHAPVQQQAAAPYSLNGFTCTMVNCHTGPAYHAQAAFQTAAMTHPSLGYTCTMIYCPTV